MKLGVFQPDAAGLTLADRVDSLKTALTGQDLDLVVCPELYATGYHIAGSHKDLAAPSDGAYLNAFADIARRHNTAILYGYPESRDGKVYNAAALVSAEGKLRANHRKQLPSPQSFEETSFSPHNGLAFVDLMDLRVAIAICFEVEFPETARTAARSGAHLLAVPTALVEEWPVVAEKLVPTRAFENGLWIAYANHAGSENGHCYLGGSRIVAPDGQEAALAGAGSTLIQAQIDAGAVTRARARLPYLDHAAKL